MIFISVIKMYSVFLYFKYTMRLFNANENKDPYINFRNLAKGVTALGAFILLVVLSMSRT